MTPAIDQGRIPRQQLEDIIASIYATADALGWEHLSPSRRTLQYDLWVSAPDVGRVLGSYMTNENARSWIKDGPMKEYARARRGTGRYARFGNSNGTSVEQIVFRALGENYKVVPESVGIKPSHCRAAHGGELAFVTWGDARNLRHLVWAGIDHVITNPTTRVVIVILESPIRPSTSAETDRQDKIAKRCGFEVRRVRDSLRSLQRAAGTVEI